MWPFSKNERSVLEHSDHLARGGQDAVLAQSQAFAPPSVDEVTPILARDYNYEQNLPPNRLDDHSSDTSQRLGVAPQARIPLISGVSFVAGFAIGSAVGGTTAGLRYRAENAHNVPKSSVGWYLYNKSKNYHVMLGGVTEGMKNGAKYAAWTALFLSIEEGLDRARGKIFASKSDKDAGRLAMGQRDVLNTLSAAVALSGMYGRWNNFDVFTAKRMTKRAVKFAIPFGLAQDALATVRGEGPWYVEMVLGRSGTRGPGNQVI